MSCHLAKLIIVAIVPDHVSVERAAQYMYTLLEYLILKLILLIPRTINIFSSLVSDSTQILDRLQDLRPQTQTFWRLGVGSITVSS